jgi:hypothetical protein
MGMRISFYTDEHVARAVVRGLRHRGVDVLTVPEAGLLDAMDEEHVERARAERRVLFTQDEDFDGWVKRAARLVATLGQPCPSALNTAPRWQAAWWRHQRREGRGSGSEHRSTEASSAVAARHSTGQIHPLASPFGFGRPFPLSHLRHRKKTCGSSGETTPPQRSTGTARSVLWLTKTRTGRPARLRFDRAIPPGRRFAAG